jgi:hypothetical protein
MLARAATASQGSLWGRNHRTRAASSPRYRSVQALTTIDFAFLENGLDEALIGFPRHISASGHAAVKRP